MKEATGELNITVITVVAIAAVGAFFYAFVWPVIRNNLSRNTWCNSATCTSCSSTSSGRTCTGCTYQDEAGSNVSIAGQCKYSY